MHACYVCYAYITADAYTHNYACHARGGKNPSRNKPPHVAVSRRPSGDLLLTVTGGSQSSVPFCPRVPSQSPNRPAQRRCTVSRHAHAHLHEYMHAHVHENMCMHLCTCTRRFCTCTCTCTRPSCACISTSYLRPRYLYKNIPTQNQNTTQAPARADCKVRIANQRSHVQTSRVRVNTVRSLRPVMWNSSCAWGTADGGHTIALARNRGGEAA